MADTKTSALTALTGAGTATGDKIPIDDVSATTLKSITISELAIALGVPTGTGSIAAYSDSSYRSGAYYSPFGIPNSNADSPVAATNNILLNANSLHCYTFKLDEAVTWDRIGLYCPTVSAAFNVRLGVYSANGTGGLPSTLLVDFGALAVGTAGWKELTCSQALAANTEYWLALLCDSTLSGSNFIARAAITRPRQAGTTGQYVNTVARQGVAYGALPGTTTATLDNGWGVPVANFRKA